MNITDQLRKNIPHTMLRDQYVFRQRLRELEKHQLNESMSAQKLRLDGSEDVSHARILHQDSCLDDKPINNVTDGRIEFCRSGKTDVLLKQLAEDIKKSVALATWRRENIPRVTYDETLPVCQCRDEIKRAIRDHQVVVICGETGSGKSTQIPKICLELGLGVKGFIGHTQPRRIAARSISARLTEELSGETLLGIPPVGYKIRFSDQTNPRTYIKLMTDGILLAETQSDRYLEQYEVLIIDEAHERSLNIDFILGYLRRLVDRRKNLKVIITSATIDSQRFSEHFTTPTRKVPVLEVQGRTYPVEVIYHPVGESDEEETYTDNSADSFPISSAERDEGKGRRENGRVRSSQRDPDIHRAVIETLGLVTRMGPGDILVFMPTERDIHEVVKLLGGSIQREITDNAPTERIHSQRSALVRRYFAAGGTDIDILPLYARLPASQQQRIFQTGGRRRVVIATNVAESSITVPGIRYVIDTGTARISRYSSRTKTQRLPIEAVSQASADQRKGRCGRVGPGVCIRLYSEADYNTRDRYTQPEILRTNLASVILQTKVLNLGDVETFPFLDPPRTSAIRDGYKTLFELGALSEPASYGKVTTLGRQLSRLPVDPRIGRMILAASEEKIALKEILIISAALEVRDPRERPMEKQEEADSAHSRFHDPDSDFLGLLKLWDFYHQLREKLSRSQLRTACLRNYISYNRMREWVDIYHQLCELIIQHEKDEKNELSYSGKNVQVTKKISASEKKSRPDTALKMGLSQLQETAGLAGSITPIKYSAIHRAILTGFLSNIGFRSSPWEYSVGGGKSSLWPGSSLRRRNEENPHSKIEVSEGKILPDTPSEDVIPEEREKKLPPLWVVAAEMVETTKRYLRMAARVEPQWIEECASHLVSRTYSDPHWVRSSGCVMAYEKVSLFGLTLVARRSVNYGPISPQNARGIFIQSALVEGELNTQASFFSHNRVLLERLEQMETRLRRRDFLFGAWKQYEFYDQRIPLEVYDHSSLEKWLKYLKSESPSQNIPILESLKMTEKDILKETVGSDVFKLYPDVLPGMDQPLPLKYQFEPGSPDDGISLCVTLGNLSQVDPYQLDWGVPGQLQARITALMKSLPREIRRRLIPMAENSQKISQKLQFAHGDLLENLAYEVSRLTGMRVLSSDFQKDRIPDNLRLNICLSDSDGTVLIRSRDWNEILHHVDEKATRQADIKTVPSWNRDGITQWDFGSLNDLNKSAHKKGYPMLMDQKKSVSLRMGSSPLIALQETRRAVIRLFCLDAKKDIIQQISWIPGINEMKIHARPFLEINQLTLDEIYAEALARLASCLVAEDPLTQTLCSGRVPKKLISLLHLPEDETQFTQFSRSARARIPQAVQILTSLLPALWDAYGRAYRTLNSLCFSEKKEVRTFTDFSQLTSISAAKRPVESSGNRSGEKNVSVTLKKQRSRLVSGGPGGNTTIFGTPELIQKNPFSVLREMSLSTTESWDSRKDTGDPIPKKQSIHVKIPSYLGDESLEGGTYLACRETKKPHALQAQHSSRQFLVDDITQQLAELFPEDFLLITPWEWLCQYPRYLNAITERILRSGSSAAASLVTDDATREINKMYARYLQRKKDHQIRGFHDPELILFRWMLEEYRVSIFAQKLGTRMPVSLKRLEKQWEKIRN